MSEEYKEHEAQPHVTALIHAIWYNDQLSEQEKMDNVDSLMDIYTAIGGFQ